MKAVESPRDFVIVKLQNEIKTFDIHIKELSRFRKDTAELERIKKNYEFFLDEFLKTHFTAEKLVKKQPEPENLKTAEQKKESLEEIKKKEIKQAVELSAQRQKLAGVTETITAKAKKDGYKDPAEMLWIKKFRLKRKLEEFKKNKADDKLIQSIHSQIKEIDYMLKEGVEILKQEQIKRQNEEQAQLEKQKADKLKNELSGLFDEINK